MAEQMFQSKLSIFTKICLELLFFFEINTCHPFLFVALDGCLLFIYVFLLKALVLATTLLF